MAFFRRLRQLFADPVLLRWLWLNKLNPAYRSKDFSRIAKLPPYLKGELGRENPSFSLPENVSSALPQGELKIILAGREVVLTPDSYAFVFKPESFTDTEIHLAAHRFAWLPLLENINPAWVRTLWEHWVENYAENPQGWPWNAYTAAERAINIIEYSLRYGKSSANIEQIIADHPPLIAKNLEYFGEDYTSNHLSNNGRGLYAIGLYLGLPQAEEWGRKILINEAKRIFMANGSLREESTHYQLLLLRNYAHVFLLANKFNRPEVKEFAAITQKAWGILPHLQLPAGLPLIGDISPDCPPEFLYGFLSGEELDRGWIARRSPEEKMQLAAMKQSLTPPSREALAKEGWLRADMGDWAGLWHLPPKGWAFMPGHGHQDCGSFVLDYQGEAVFIDPGRGAYGEAGEASLYTQGLMHNIISVNGNNPYPINRPYYSDIFREKIGGKSPTFTLQDNIYINFQNISRNFYQESHNILIINDKLDGKGRKDISQILITPLIPETNCNNQLFLRGKKHDFMLEVEARPIIREIKRWQAYGKATQAWRIEIKGPRKQPFTGKIKVIPISK